jgi:hypothetical protein
MTRWLDIKEMVDQYHRDFESAYQSSDEEETENDVDIENEAEDKKIHQLGSDNGVPEEQTSVSSEDEVKETHESEASRTIEANKDDEQRHMAVITSQTSLADGSNISNK